MSTTTTQDSRFADALADYAGSMRARVLFSISAIALSVTHVMYGVTISGYYALGVIAALVSLGGMFLSLPIGPGATSLSGDEFFALVGAVVGALAFWGSTVACAVGAAGALVSVGAWLVPAYVVPGAVATALCFNTGLVAWHALKNLM